MASVTVGESQLQRIIRDLQDAVLELKQEQQDLREPVTDDSASLHKFCFKLEYLLQFDQKEKKTLLGTRKDYWDYFCDCLGKMKGASDGLRYVRSIPELKTSLGKGRAFIRYSLVHQRLADTLQQCLMNQRVTSDWYYARSPFLKPHLNVDIVNHLYELNEVQFDVASRGYDLDSSWPSFARRTLGSPAQLWRPPSRSSSVSSLVSSYSQQAPELLCSPEPSPGFLGDVCILGPDSCCGTEDMRLELDRSELRQRQLQEHVEQLSEEAEGLREQVRALEEQQEAAEQEVDRDWDLEARLSGAEQRNTELLARLDAALFEKGQQVAGQQDSAQKIHALLDKLNKAEKGRLEAQREAEELRRRKVAVPMQERIAELQHANDKLRGDLVVKEKESSNLQMQMLDLQGAMEATERQVHEARRRTQEEKEELEEKHSRVREALEGQFHALAEQLKAKELELSKSKEKIRLLEEQKEEVLGEKEGLSARLTKMEASVLGQEWKTEDYKVQCSTLVELNAKLFEMVKRNEEAKMELTEARVALQGELSALRALKTDSLQWPSDTADDLVKSVTEEMVEGDAQRLEQENQELREEQGAVKEALSSMQEELRFFGSHIAELERSLASSSRSESNLREQLRETSALLEERERWCKELQARLEVAERQQSGTGSSLSRLALEGQLELREKEVSRLQSEAVDLRCELQHLAKEKLKAHAQLEVAEASREELKGQVEELKGQVEELNLRHVQETLRHQQREEALDREAEAQAFEDASTREELAALKRYQEQLSVESSEAKEALRRADAVVDELGVRVRDLTARNEEASARLKELAEENGGLQEELRRFEGIEASTRELQERLEQAESRARVLHESARAEADTARFQLSSEALNHQNKLKCIHEELAGVKAQLTAERDRVSGLEAEVSQLKAENCGCSQLLEETRVLIEKSESVIRQKDVELDRLSENLTKCEGELAAMRAACHNIQEQLDRTVSKRRDGEMKMSAEIDDLYRTKKNLEERLIELIREKDELWQKSNALEFQQKLQCEGLSDRDGSQCLGCQEQFSWFLRRHPCRLCSRTLCYYCSNSTTRMLPSGKRERCCRDCGLVQERPLEANSGTSGSSNSHSSPCRAASSIKVTDQSPINDDGAFDIITEEELNGEFDSDSLSHTPERSQGSPKHRSSSTRHTSLDSDDLTPAVQDAETYLLKSGELTLTVPLSMEEIACFGQDCRELFVKSSCYSTIPIAVPDAGHTISWSFSSEPKSISFSMVHHEAEDAPVEQSKVLIPLTRCNSHKETVQGQVKVRSPGIYTLIFDNSFSRFISKKVLYHLAIKKSDIA